MVVAFAFSLFSLEAQLLHLLLVLLNFVHQLTLTLPFGSEGCFLVAQFGDVLVQLLNFLLVVLTANGFALNFQLLQLTSDVVELLRNRVALHAKLSGGLVHQVDGLVGKESLADVSLRELHGSDAGVVLNTYLVMILIALLQSTKDGDGREFVGFVDHHRLETTLQRLVLFEVLLVFVQRGSTDGTQLTTCQGRLQDVSSIHGSLAAAGSHQRMNLVDEEDDFAFGLRHLLHDALQSLLELTFVLRTCQQCTHVEREELLVLQVFWHVATYDSLGETFHDGGLTRTRLTNQDRVVLRTA